MAVTLPTREFFFLRHGETEYNREGRFQGRIDVPLNSAGLTQAESAAELLATRRITRVISSPAQRVLQTIQPFLQAQDLPLQVDDDLMEFFVGSFEGRRIADVRQEQALESGASWLSILPDDAELWPQFVSRVCIAVARWTDLHAEETILIASHGLVFRALVEALTGQALSSQNAQPHCFSPIEAGWAVSPLAS